MARFYTEYQSNEILRTFLAGISWPKHIVILTKCKDAQQRQFYILATKNDRWTNNVLLNKIEPKLLRTIYLDKAILTKPYLIK